MAVTVAIKENLEAIGVPKPEPAPVAAKIPPSAKLNPLTIVSITITKILFVCLFQFSF